MRPANPNLNKSAIALAAQLLAPTAALHAAETTPPSARPNIVFIYADDWGWGDLSCHGNTWLKTPRIDKSAVYGGPGPRISASGNEIPEKAVAFIEANKDHPFYLNVWLHESHLAHTPSAESMARWKHLDERQQVYAAVISDGDWKLAMTSDGKRIELHNLKSDRAEEAGKDLAKEHPEICARLTTMALDWYASLPTKADPACVDPDRGAGKRSAKKGEAEE